MSEEEGGKQASELGPAQSQHQEQEPQEQEEEELYILGDDQKPSLMQVENQANDNTQVFLADDKSEM